MSDSPPKNEQETEQGAQSGEEPDLMDREQEGAQQGLGDFEVKEQDRWLPIANGWFCFLLLFRIWLDLYFDLFVPCVTLLRACALTMAFVRTRWLSPSRKGSLGHSSHSLRPPSLSTMKCIPASPSLAKRYLRE
jgi:hypothetical protein